MKAKDLFVLLLVFLMLSCNDHHIKIEDHHVDKNLAVESSTAGEVKLRAGVDSKGVQFYDFPANTYSKDYAVKLNGSAYYVYQFDDQWDSRNYCQFRRCGQNSGWNAI